MTCAVHELLQRGSVCTVAVAGLTSRGTCVARLATGVTRAFGSSSWAFGLPEVDSSQQVPSGRRGVRDEPRLPDGQSERSERTKFFGVYSMTKVRGVNRCYIKHLSSELTETVSMN